ncbi:MAG: FprA family A-type flavoprotein [Marinilabiliales bacterium]
MTDNKTVKINENVHWIGILDYDIRKFDIVMETKYGTTYNSYFINGEKKAIIETAKEKFSDTYIEKVKQVINPSEIDYIVLNHTEPDHSGSLKHLLKIAPKAKVVGSGNTIRYLKDMIEDDFEHITIKDGDEISLGNKTLRFISAPNLHWPDSTYTYLVEDKLLFTCDSFGSHFCHDKIFDDLVGDFDDAFKYYFDVILKPYSKFMIKAIEKIRALEINTICTGHGPILRTHWKKYVDLSEKYALEYLNSMESQKKRVFIAYVSAYGYTKEMAEEILKGITSVTDVNIDLADIEEMEIGELDSKLTISDAILVGSPTINQNILMPIYKLFAVINPIRDKGKLAGSFGSYGWSGEGVKIIDSVLKSLKLNVAHEGIGLKFRPDSKDKETLFEFGKEFAKKLLAC